jgi:3-oxoacyl-[acyl-carrier protein] reductase
MNLGIAGRSALVCAASKGLGKAYAQTLVSEGVNVVTTAILTQPRRWRCR